MASERSDSPPGASGAQGAGLFDFGAMMEAMETARRSWSSFALPGSLGPTLDPAELDKRIADLRTVEQWLSLNLNLLRGSVQALELQRATLGSLREFGAAAQAATQAASEAAARAAAQSGTATAPAQGEPPVRDEIRSSPPHGETSPGPGPAQAAEGAPQTQGAPWPGVDAGAWWQMLQSQFRQVTESAMAGLQPGQLPGAPVPPATPATQTRKRRQASEGESTGVQGPGKGRRGSTARGTRR